MEEKCGWWLPRGEYVEGKCGGRRSDGGHVEEKCGLWLTRGEYVEGKCGCRGLDGGHVEEKCGWWLPHGGHVEECCWRLNSRQIFGGKSVTINYADFWRELVEYPPPPRAVDRRVDDSSR